MMGYGFDMWGGGIWMVFFWIVVVGLAVWGLKLLFSPGARSNQQPPAPTSSALEIARIRYSRGEISREEYLAIVEDLQFAEELPKAKRSEW